MMKKIWAREKRQETSIHQITGIVVLLFFSFLALSVGNKIHAANRPVLTGTVYIDSNPSIGNNANDGRSPSKPWLTIEKLNEYEILPGARILFKKGGQWRGSVNVPHTGNVSAGAIYYGSYGQGGKPIINGAIRINNWKPYNDGDPKSNIYVADNVTQRVSQLIVNGQRQILARYPNRGSSDKFDYAYNTITDTCSDNRHGCLIDRNNLQQPDYNYWVGADIHIKTRSWEIEKARITGFRPAQNKIIIGSKTIFDIKEGYGYYIENKLEELDAPGEWYYHAGEKKLYYWPLPDAPISNSIIEGTVVNRGFTAKINPVKNVIIEGFDIRNFAEEGIRFGNAFKMQFIGNKINNCGTNGIESGTDRSRISEDITIRNNEITNVLNNGIVVSKTKGCKIENNNIRFCKYKSISYLDNSNGVIKNNRITDSGHNGISMFGASLAGNLVEGNIIDRFCRIVDDGGGIYCSSNNGLSNQVKNNLITNSIGNTDGCPLTHTQGQGIYLDELANDYVVSGNVVVNTDYGIQIHNSNSNTIKNNIIYNARNSAAIITHNGDGKMANAVHNNDLNGSNIFHSLVDQRACVYLGTTFQGCPQCGVDGFGTFDQNYYSHPNIESTFFSRSPGDPQSFTLDEWQATTANDSNSVIFDGTQSEILINYSQTTKTFDLKNKTYVTLDNEPVETSVEIGPLKAKVLIRKELNCTDGLDNDGDRRIDDNDPDCDDSIVDDQRPSAPQNFKVM